MPMVKIDAVSFRHNCGGTTAQVGALPHQAGPHDRTPTACPACRRCERYRQSRSSGDKRIPGVPPRQASRRQSRPTKGLPKSKRASLDGCLKAYDKLNVSVPLPEAGEVTTCSKPSGGHRIICEFGLQHRTAQMMLQWALEKQFVPRPFQFTFRGVPAAIKEVRAQLIAGQAHLATLDIVDHFGNFSEGKLLKALPLPSGWVQHTVVTRWMAMLRMRTCGVSLSTNALLLRGPPGRARRFDLLSDRVGVRHGETWLGRTPLAGRS